MMGLWADGWFYISSAGLLVSGILFFFLLGQYRVASEAADVTEGEQGSDKEAFAVSAAIRPVYIPEEAPAPRVASHSDKPESKPESKPEFKPEFKPKTEDDSARPERRKDAASTTGGISPAVIYLQNIKVELADLHKDLRALAARVDSELAAVSTRDEALIDRLGELARAVESMKAAEPAKPEPAAKKARKAEKAPELEPAPEPAPEPEPEPAPVVLAAAPEPEPVPEPKAAPALSPNETMRLELGALVSPPAPLEPKIPAAEPEPASALPKPPPEEKPRRGPVWPV